ncbi:MAG: ECF transporter S component [Burkholderiales bacterium]|nr:ECF transporter S component [Burkholderiales bacterium]
MSNKLNLHDFVFIAIMSTAIAIAWWGYSFFYNIISPILKPFGLSGLIEGIWLISGIFFGIIIRKPGSAILGSMIAATIEGFISQWGLSALISGFFQGLPVELIFLAFSYNKWNKIICAIAGALSALCGYLVTFFWYNYSSFGIKYNLLNLGCGMLSGAILGGLLARYIALNLAKTGALNQFAIARGT